MNTSHKFSPVPNNDVIYRIVAPALSLSEYDALKELVDNSIDAKANEIIIEINKDYRRIFDNGKGMNYDQLRGSLTFGLGSSHDLGDLGKFSIGGTTASCTLGLNRTIITRNKDNEVLTGIQNIEDINNTIIRPSSEEEINKLNKFTSSTGTIIEISNLNKSKLKYKRTNSYLESLPSALGKTYYAMLDKVNINIVIDKNTVKVQSEDPLVQYNNSEAVLESEIEELLFDNKNIKLRKVYLDFSKVKEENRKGKYQGIYYLRNNRIIEAAQIDKKLWGSRHNSTNSARIEISFSEDLDEHFSVSATKNKVIPSEEIKEFLYLKTKGWARHVTSKEDERNKSKVSNLDIQKSIDSFTEKLDKNGHEINIPKNTNKISTKKERRNSSGESKGSIKPSNTGAKRNNYEKILPNFKMTNEPYNIYPFYIDHDENELSITINKAHKFSDKFFEKGNDLTKEMFMVFATAIAYTEFDTKDMPNEKTVSNYLYETYLKLKKIMEIM